MSKARDIADFKFENITDTGTEGTKIATGTTAQRPASPNSGRTRFNTTIQLPEYYDGTDWKAIDAPPVISSVSPTEVESAGGGTVTFTITGNSFSVGAIAKVVSSSGTEVTATTTVRNSGISLSATFNESSFSNSSEPYDIKVVNSSGLAGVLEDQIYVDNAPTWSTTSGNIASIYDNATGTHATVSATDPEGDTVSYSETSGTVLSTNNLSLNSSTGAISGDPVDQSVGGSSTLSFNLRATANGKTSDRAFNIIVNAVVADSGGGAGYATGASTSTNATGITNGSMTVYNQTQAASPATPANLWNYGWESGSYVSTNFSAHSGHNGQPAFYAVQVVSGSGTPRVCNQIQWIKHANSIGNCDVYGSNQSITSSNFTTISNWTNIGRLHFGGSSSASDGTVISQNFNSNNYGFRWYLFVARDNDSTPSASNGTPTGWAMYSARLNKI